MLVWRSLATMMPYHFEEHAAAYPIVSYIVDSIEKGHEKRCTIGSTKAFYIPGR